MDLSHKAVRVAVCGMTATGKSTFCERYLRNSSARRVYIFDHQSNEFAQRLQCPVLSRCSELDNFSGRIRAYDPYTEFEGDIENAFRFYCRYVYEVNEDSNERTLFFVDEMDMLQGYNNVWPELRDLMVAGRRRKIDVIFICQQLNLIHNTLRNTMTELVVFRTNDMRALEYPAQLGLDIEEIRALPDCHYLHLDLKTQKQTKGCLYGIGKSKDDNREKREGIACGDANESERVDSGV